MEGIVEKVAHFYNKKKNNKIIYQGGNEYLKPGDILGDNVVI